MKNLSKLAILLLLFASGQFALAANKEFPGRDLYPSIPYIELDDFHKKFSETVVVDVRSQYEFSTLHIKGAKNIPLSGKTFVNDMRQLRAKTDKKIVVYCNGRTCMKSYKAARKAGINDIKGVVAFDAGIMDWSKAHPKLAVLLDEPLNDAKKLISKEKFHDHLISPSKFGERIASTNDIVLDVRDRFQREGLSMFVGREYRVSLDDKRKLLRYIKKAQGDNKALLIYDAAGKQVRWLQYYLEQQNMKNYYFMKGGIRAYYNGMTADLSR